MVNVVGELYQHKTKRFRKRPLDVIDKIILHHSATPSGSPQAFARYHVMHNNWAGIGYHYVINKNSTVYLCNHIDTHAAHTYGQNRTGIGICLVGNYDQEEILPVILYASNPFQDNSQWSALDELVYQIRRFLSKDIPVYPHRKFRKTSCPGINITDEMINRL